MSTLKNIEAKICKATEISNHLQKSMGKTVFTNGCFDLIHTGHISYLSAAADLGDALIIGLNTDASVQRLKGPSRPIKDEFNRALVLASFSFVDLVVLFDEDTPFELITAIKPDVLVKGGDYDPYITDPKNPKYIVGSKEVKQNGGKVETIAFVDGHSSTRLIERSKQ